MLAPAPQMSMLLSLPQRPNVQMEGGGARFLSACETKFSKSWRVKFRRRSFLTQVGAARLELDGVCRSFSVMVNCVLLVHCSPLFGKRLQLAAPDDLRKRKRRRRALGSAAAPVQAIVANLLA